MATKKATTEGTADAATPAVPAAPAGPTKEEKAAIKAAAKAAKDAAKMPEQNGVRRPKAGTVIGKVWELLDAASATKQAPAALADVKAEADAAQINVSTLRTQYARWKKFNNVTGRVPKAETPAAPAATEGQAAA